MKKTEIRHVDLALQGGGAHGAFTWGVLDRLLEDERIEIDAVSGTSAGAMNAVVLADGLMDGGRVGARAALRRFWTALSNAVGHGPAVSSPLSAFFGHWALENAPVNAWLDCVGRSMSPYQFNPLDINPLRNIVAAEVDFERVRACDKLKLFVSATHVASGKLHEFDHRAITVDAVMASACLPLLFKAVEIDGEAYWDGGYLGNPSLMPLIEAGPTDDLILVQINPSHREKLPTTTREIVDRIDEITFNASLVKELRTIALIRRLLDQRRESGALPGALPGAAPRAPTAAPTGAPLFGRIASLRMHRIEAEAALSALGVSSRGNAGWPFLQNLHRIGYETTDQWLDAHFSDLGRKATLSLDAYVA